LSGNGEAGIPPDRNRKAVLHLREFRALRIYQDIAFFTSDNQAGTPSNGSPACRLDSFIIPSYEFSNLLQTIAWGRMVMSPEKSLTRALLSVYVGNSNSPRAWASASWRPPMIRRPAARAFRFDRRDELADFKIGVEVELLRDEPFVAFEGN
jgi:hypothetical protein